MSNDCIMIIELFRRRFSSNLDGMVYGFESAFRYFGKAILDFWKYEYKLDVIRIKNLKTSDDVCGGAGCSSSKRMIFAKIIIKKSKYRLFSVKLQIV